MAALPGSLPPRTQALFDQMNEADRGAPSAVLATEAHQGMIEMNREMVPLVYNLIGVMQRLQRENALLESKNRELAGSMNVLRERVHMFSEDFDASRRAIRRDVAALGDQYDTLNTNHNNFALRVTTAERDIRNAQLDIGIAERDIGTLNTNVTELTKKVDGQGVRITALENEGRLSADERQYIKAKRLVEAYDASQQMRRLVKKLARVVAMGAVGGGLFPWELAKQAYWSWTCGLALDAGMDLTKRTFNKCWEFGWVLHHKAQQMGLLNFRPDDIAPLSNAFRLFYVNAMVNNITVDSSGIIKALGSLYTDISKKHPNLLHEIGGIFDATVANLKGNPENKVNILKIFANKMDLLKDKYKSVESFIELIKQSFQSTCPHNIADYAPVPKVDTEELAWGVGKCLAGMAVTWAVVEGVDFAIDCKYPEPPGVKAARRILA